MMHGRWVALAAILVAGAAAAGAQEERAIDNFAGVGVRAMGMGGAYVGVADDFTAVYWNPAGLAQMTRRQVYVAFARNDLENRATTAPGSADASRATAAVRNTRFGSLGAVYPWPVYQGSFVLAAGFNRVKDFDWVLDRPLVPVRFDATGAVVGDSVAFDDDFSHEGEMTITSVAAAVDVSPAVSLGLTLSLISGEDDRTDRFRDIDAQDFFIEKQWFTRRTFTDTYETTWMATFGAMLRTPRDDPRLRVGFTVTTGPTHEVRYVLVEPDTAVGFDAIEDDAGTVRRFGSVETTGSYKIDLPLAFAAGISLRVHPDLLVAASVQAVEWTQTEYAKAPAIADRLNDFEVQYDDVLRTHLGVEWQVPWLALDLRAGTYTDPLPFVGPRDASLPVDAATNPPVRIVQDRRFWTLGAGLLVDETVRTEVSWTRGSYVQAEGRGPAELREAVTVNRVFAGVSYRF